MKIPPRRRGLTALLALGLPWALLAQAGPARGADTLKPAKISKVPPAPPPARVGKIQISVVPERPDWTYAVGEKITFLVRVTRDGHPATGLRAHYELGLEQLPPTHGGDIEIPAEGIAVESEPLATPGFIVCTVEIEDRGHKYSGRGAAGVAPDKIAPTAPNPDDFDAFWAIGKQQLAAIPLDARLTPAPERSRPGAECFHASIASVPARAPAVVPGRGAPGTSRLYGILCEPEGRGPFPAVLLVPGAGVRPYQGATELTAKGVITFTIGIHGVPVNLDPEVYDSLSKGAIDNYPNIHSDDRDRYYYRRVFLGALRGNDLLTSRPRWDRQNLGVSGGSQGGALAIITAGLDARVRALVSFYPALADHTGFLHGRTGGWPFLLRQEAARTPARIATLPYFDVVNFARRVKAPGFYSWGFNDATCPPTSLFSTYNVINAPKNLLLALETGHSTIAEQNEKADAWLLDRLGVKTRDPASKK